VFSGCPFAPMRKTSTIHPVVLIQYQLVTDGQTDVIHDRICCSSMVPYSQNCIFDFVFCMFHQSMWITCFQIMGHVHVYRSPRIGDFCVTLLT